MPDFGSPDVGLSVDVPAPYRGKTTLERREHPGCMSGSMTSKPVSKRDRARRALVRSRFFPAILPPTAGRVMDVAIAALALVFLAPLMLVVAGLIALFDPGPILFRHQRVGLGGRMFQVYKFRSMRAGGEDILRAHLEGHPEALAEWGRDHKLRRDPRVTPLGSFLRRSSVDELPQLFNVLRGDMSIVGPRPIVEAEVERYGPLFAAYCSVRPGITGIWQVSGRNDVTYERRVQMDALYARQKTVYLDIKLMLATIPAVLSRKGSY